MDGKAQVTIVTRNKSFWKFVGLKSEAFLNLIKHFQRLNDYNTVISYFFPRQTFLRQQYLIFDFFSTAEESSGVWVLFDNAHATQSIKTLQMLTLLEWFDQYGNSLKFLIIFEVFFYKFWYILNLSLKHPLAWQKSPFIIGFLSFG